MSDQELLVPEVKPETGLALQRVAAQLPAGTSRDGSADGAEGTGVNPLAMVMRIVRGRMPVVAALAVVLGILGAVGGYSAKQPTYASTGIVQVFPNKTSILYNDRDDSRLRLFDAFANAEASFLLSNPVLELAVEDPTLSRIGWPGGMKGVARLKQVMAVERKGGLIFVTGTDENAEYAAALVNGVLTAYLQQYHKQLQHQDRVRERELGMREQDLVAKVADLDRQIVEIGGEYNLASIAGAHVRKVAQTEEVDQRIADLAMNIATKESQSGQNNVDIGDQEIKRLLVLDHAMADMLFERSKLAGELEHLQSQHAKEHREVIETQAKIRIIDQSIEERRSQLATLGSVGALSKSGDATESLEDLKALRERFVDRHKLLREEARQLNERLVRLESKSKDREQAVKLLDETRKALEQVRVESQHSLPGTVEIRSRGAVPASPAGDKRLAFGVAGGMLGGVTGLGLVVGYGLLFRRYRFSDDLSGGHPWLPLAGVLPDVDEEPIDDQPDFLHALQRLTVDLQLRSVGTGCAEVLAVTGSRSDAGCSTVALGLARAFAAAHVNTVLVDADLQRSGLTSSHGMEGAEGLREVLLTGHLNGQLTDTTGNSLRILPAGNAVQMTDKNISRRSMAHFLHQLRQKCDLVVLDLGPLEQRTAARLGVGLADHAVLVVPAGDELSEIQPAIEALQKLAADRATAVMNFAHSSDPGLLTAPSEVQSRTLSITG